MSPLRHKFAWVASATAAMSCLAVLASMAHAQSPTASTAASGSAPSQTAPTVPTEQQVPAQVLWLRSGAVLRGDIVEYVPDSHVTLQLATGEVRTIPWSDVLRSSWVRSPAAAAPTTPPAPSGSAPHAASPAASASSAPQPRGVRVELGGDEAEYWLEARHRFRAKAEWKKACEPPCNRELEVNSQSFRVNGQDMPPSNPFFFEGSSGHESLTVSSGSTNWLRLGHLSLLAGIGLAFASGVVYGVANMENEHALEIGGIVGMALGGVLVVGALPMLSVGKTSVRNSKGEQVGGASWGMSGQF